MLPGASGYEVLEQLRAQPATRDIAVLSQLTNTIRLYGTDCNQTEMTLHSIKALNVPMKVWLGVWQDDTNN